MKLVTLKVGWKDIRKRSANIDLMVVYGKLKWIYKLEDDEINKIISIYPFDKKKLNKHHRNYIPLHRKDFDNNINKLIMKDDNELMN